MPSRVCYVAMEPSCEAGNVGTASKSPHPMTLSQTTPSLILATLYDHVWIWTPAMLRRCDVTPSVKGVQRYISW